MTWDRPSEPNGNITNYQVIYYEYEETTETGRSNLLSSAITTYNISNLSKQLMCT